MYQKVHPYVLRLLKGQQVAGHRHLPCMLQTHATSRTAVILSGWKEIANYLGRGVRTVQRWEKLGLPIRRPSAHLRTAVLARCNDLDAWLDNAATGPQIMLSELRKRIQALEAENADLSKELLRLRTILSQRAPSVARRSSAA